MGNCLLVTRAGHIRPVDECIPLFLALLKEMRVLGESKGLSVSGVDQENVEVKSKIS